MSGLMDHIYSVSCGIEIENWTKFPLTYPVVKLAGGVLEIPPRDILPSKREAMVARKTSGTATGSSGTVSWLIEKNTHRIVIMWSVPYDSNVYRNWLGVGITPQGETSHADGDLWFNHMYYGTSSDSFGFSRREYYMESSPVTYRDDLFEISGTMSTGHHAQVKITVRPIELEFLAAPVKALLE